MLLKEVSLTFGSDPEFFFVKKGKVVPSDKVIKGRYEAVHCDGFQAELSPTSSYCRELAGNNIARGISVALDLAKKAGCTLSLEQGYEVDDETFFSVPASERRFGCNPTESIYEPKFKRVTGMRERFRSGGGHLHIGLPGSMRGDEEKAKKIVRIMDIVVGNTCVPFDQSEASTRRRKHYGRAGEYRMKRYGLEYRVPSNFWLRGYPLWSMVAGLMRTSVQIAATSKIADDLLSSFSELDIRNAINNNDKELALKNLDKYHNFLVKHEITNNNALNYYNIDTFLEVVRKKDPASYFGLSSKKSSFANWYEKRMFGTPGFESIMEDLEDDITSWKR